MKFQGTKKHMKQGLSFFKKGDHQRAIKEFELILHHDKEYVRAYNNLGYIYRTIGDYAKALEVWSEGLAMDPSYRRLQKNISSLQRLIRSKEKGGNKTFLGIEDFRQDIKWLSDEADLVEIREGRFFETYLIEDGGLAYALKTPRKQMAISQETIEAFRNACKAWLSLGPCKYIVRALSTETVRGAPFLVLDFAADSSVRDLIDNTSAIGALDAAEARSVLLPAQATEFAIQCSLAAHWIHTELGVPHGDLRPEHLLLSSSSSRPEEYSEDAGTDFRSLKVTDTGQWAVFERAETFYDWNGRIASIFAREGLVRTASGYLTLSPAYCAPELLESITTPTFATDIYAFGVTLYEMLTGSVPFPGQNPEEILQSFYEGRPRDPSSIDIAIPGVISSLTMRCLEPRPDSRFSTFAEIADLLIGYLEETQPALNELSEICKRFRKTSQFQFRDQKTNSSVMIVGGTESASEVDQIWEIVRRDAFLGAESATRERLGRIEDALLVPGCTIGQFYPTPADVLDALAMRSASTYREEFDALLQKDHAVSNRKGHMNGTESEIDPDLTPDESCAESVSMPLPQGMISETALFGPEVTAKYSSFIDCADTENAARLLTNALLSRLEMLITRPEEEELMSRLRTLASTGTFAVSSIPILQELSEVCDCPDPCDFLSGKREPNNGITAAITGFVFMLGGRFESALKAFNMISDEFYLPALNIFVWAMARFQKPEFQQIRLNSLRNSASILRDGIAANKDEKKQNTIVASRNLNQALLDSLFLRALVMEQLAEHKSAIWHFRATKQVSRAQQEIFHSAQGWVDLVQGKSMFELGMPSEALIRWHRALTKEIDAPFFKFLELGPDRPTVLLAGYLLNFIEDTLAHFTNTPVVQCTKAKLLVCIGQNSEALECLSRASQIEVDFFPLEFVRMQIMVSQEQYQDALDAIRICALREPNDPVFMLREAEILCRLNEGEKALGELRRAIGHGLEIGELKASIKKKRFSQLEAYSSYMDLTKDLNLS